MTLQYVATVPTFSSNGQALGGRRCSM